MTSHTPSTTTARDAMAVSGYRPKARGELNHHYRLHPSSPAFLR